MGRREMLMENEELFEFEKHILAVLSSDATIAEKRDNLDDFHDYELARALVLMDKEQRETFSLCLTAKELANVFSQLAPEDAVSILRETPIAAITQIFNEMQSDDLVDIIGCFEDHDESVTFLSLIDYKKRHTVKEMLAYDDSLVGSIMNNNYLEIKKANSIKEAIRTMVQNAPATEFINNLYVVENGHLEGVLSLKEVISAGNKPTALVEDIMTVNMVTVTPWTKTEDAIELMKNYDFFLLPVVDKDNKMLGIVAFDDMFVALNKESDEDYSRLAGLTDINIDENRETVFSTVKKRMPWLVILLFVNLITSTIITGYGNVLVLIPTLALFMPIILNLAGNTGTQSLGIIIRLFATNQLDSRKAIRKHLFKELITGIVNGVIIAILLFGLVIGMRMLMGMTFASVLPFAFVIALSISVSLIVATLAGAVVPLFISLFKIDPAVASGPFITTINDIISLLIYFGLASILLANYM